jgi:hypothetical protein
MSAIRVMAYIAAAILIFFGVLFIWGAFSPSGSVGWILIGLISVGIGFGLIFLGGRMKPAAADQPDNVTLQVNLPGNVKMDTLKCQSCGGTLAPENVQMVAGAPVVTCPYCHTTYQLTEEPKW